MSKDRSEIRNKIKGRSKEQTSQADGVLKISFGDFKDDEGHSIE